ncbi:MAG: thiamine pyrophosphate-binding protein [Thermoleophilia bacterium]
MSWQADLADALVDAGADVAAYVPDSRLQGVLARLDERGVPLRGLPREEECVAYACGHALAGGRPLVLLQSSGVGNALNALGALAVPYALGVALVISMRGTLGEGNPSQVPMGRATRAQLDSLGIQCFPLADEARAPAVGEGVARLAFDASQVAAVILEPELGGQRAHR